METSQTIDNSGAEAALAIVDAGPLRARPVTPAPESAAGPSREVQQRLEAWLTLPERDGAEMIDGRIRYKLSPTVEHGDSVAGIIGQLDRLRGPVDSGGGWWLSIEVDMYLAGQGLRPDMAGWSCDRHPLPPDRMNVGTHLGVCVTAPDWVCEVMSKSTRVRDEEDGVKWQAYRQAGVAHFWLVDLEQEQITIYRRAERGYEAVDVAGFEAVKPLAPFVDVNFEVKRIFLMSRFTRSRR